MASFFASEKTDGVVVVRLSFNEITREQREEIKKELHTLLDTGETGFIIDISRVGFISSLVLATILFFSKEVTAKGGKVKVCGLSSEAYSIFQLTQLDKILELYDTEHDALQSFK